MRSMVEGEALALADHCVSLSDPDSPGHLSLRERTAERPHPALNAMAASLLRSSDGSRTVSRPRSAGPAGPVLDATGDRSSHST